MLSVKSRRKQTNIIKELAKMTNINFPVLVYPETFQAKPTDADIGKIQNYFKSKFNTSKMDFNSETLSDFLTNGYTINISILNGEKQHFVSSQLIGIDFDTDCMPLDDLIERLRKDEILPNFIYQTWSNSDEWKKYRGIWVLDEPIEDKQTYTTAVNLLIEYFGKSDKCKLKMLKGSVTKTERNIEYCSNGRRGDRREWYRIFNTLDGRKYFIGQSEIADTQCKNHNRIFHGSRGDVVFDNHNSTINKDFLISVCIEAIKARDANQDHVARLLDRLGVPSGGKSNVLIRNIKTTQNPPLGTADNIHHECARWIEYKEYLKDIDLQELTSSCELFSDSLIRELHHKETFGLISNLVFFPIDIQNRHLKAVKDFDESKNWAKTYQYITAPMNCWNFCPFAETCNPDTKLVDKTFSSPSVTDNQISFVLNKKTRFEQTINGLSQSRKILQHTIQDILTNKRHKGKIHIVNAQCGLGKTEAYLQSINDELLDNVTVAMPTHKLKKEILDRNQNGILHSINPRIVTPEMPNVPDREIISQLYSIGAYKAANKMLSDYSEGKKYLAEKAKPIRGLAFTTHEKILTTYTSNPYIIIDEDIFFSLLSVKSLSLTDINNFNVYFKSRFDFIPHDNAIHQKDLIDVEEFLDSYADFCKLYNPESNVLEFLSKANFYTQHFSYSTGTPTSTQQLLYIVKRDLPENKTIIILSATANRKFYEILYGKENIVFHSMPRLPYTATIEHHSKHSFSKSSMAKHKLIIEELTKGLIPVLTYKSYSISINHNIKFPVPYIGNLEGYDTLNDKEFIILGKAILPTESVRLISRVLYGLPDTNKFDKQKQTIKYAGKKKTKYFTYTNPEYREVDLWFTYATLTQAIGRIRPLSSNRKLTIYNDFPIA
jgi:hypothetical protein